jgi:hypothetical protein
MRGETSGRTGGATGVLVVALFVAAALIDPPRPAFDAGGSEFADFYGSHATRIAIESALLALAAPLFLWFLVTARSLARPAGVEARRVAATIVACGSVWLALFMVDVSTLAVGALRPRSPEVASALQDLEWLTMGIGAPLVSALLAAAAALSLRFGVVWPRRVGLLAAVAAPLYLLRTGTLFTTTGAFAADGLLGLYIPVVALVSWLLAASLAMALPRR